MIKNIPVDTNRLELIASGHVVPVTSWIPDPANPGRNKMATEADGVTPLQATDEQTGELLWNVDVFGESGQEGNERAEVVSVQVRAPHQPVLEKFRPVQFRDLEMRFSKNFTTNELKYYWSASGVLNPGAVSKVAASNGNGSATPVTAGSTKS